MKYYIGIDGGGTKTAVRLVDERKNILADFVRGRSNHGDVGMEASLSLIAGCVTDAAAMAGISLEDVTVVHAGIAGAASNNYIALCTERLKSVVPQAVVNVTNDAQLLFVRLEKGEGAVLICGTGSICFTLRSGVVRRIGGYGELDIFGSGSDIGKQALAYSLRAGDGREKKGALYELILDKNNGRTTLEMLSELIRGGKPVYASYAPLVFDAYRAGDKAAERIVDDNFGHLAGYLENAARDFEGSFDCVVSGGVFRDRDALGILETRISVPVRLLYTSDTVGCAVDIAMQKA